MSSEDILYVNILLFISHFWMFSRQLHRKDGWRLSSSGPKLRVGTSLEVLLFVLGSLYGAVGIWGMQPSSFKIANVVTADLDETLRTMAEINRNTNREYCTNQDEQWQQMKKEQAARRTSKTSYHELNTNERNKDTKFTRSLRNDSHKW